LISTRIRTVRAREIIDCRGYPTVEVDVELESGIVGRAGVPAGLSTGSHEACEVRDKARRYRGLGVQTAVRNVNDVIGPALTGKDVDRQRELDRFMCVELDSTPGKSKLGSNAIVGVSMALARAAAAARQMPLYRYLNPTAHVIPVPLFNLINGGKHASGGLQVQEVCIFPVGADSMSHALQIATEITFELRDLVVARYGEIAVNVGDEGGFVPPIADVREALDLLVRATECAGYADKIVYGLDVAATHFYESKEQLYGLAGKRLSRNDMITMYKQLCADYALVSIEDALSEDDFEGWAQLTAALPDIQWVGDDLFVTNPERVRRGIEIGAANAVLWKINQIGTLTEAWDVAELAYRHGYGIQVSERSGETEDSIIADFAVALNAGQIKTGAPVRGERTSKYNRLLRIEEELGNEAVYAGYAFRWRG
jgi:enolase